MQNSRTFRVLFVASLIAAMVGMVALSGWLLWPAWRKNQAVMRLSSDFEQLIAISDNDVQLHVDAFEAARARIKQIQKVGGEEMATEFLMPMLKNDRAQIRMYGAVYLGLIGPDAKRAVPALIVALEDEHIAVRVRAAIALRDIGPDAKAAVPALIDALYDDDSNVRSWSACALRRIANQVGMEIASKDDEDRELSQKVRAILLSDEAEETAGKKTAF